MPTSQWPLGVCLIYLDKDIDIQNLINIKATKQNTWVLHYSDNNKNRNDLKYQFSPKIMPKSITVKKGKNTKFCNSSSFGIFSAFPPFLTEICKVARRQDIFFSIHFTQIY